MSDDDCRFVPSAGVTEPAGAPFSRMVCIGSPSETGRFSAGAPGERAATTRGGSGLSVVRRARPKSMTRTSRSRPTITLSGLKSRWTSPFSCAATNPRPAARKTRSTSCQLRGCACNQYVTVFPSTNSIAMNT
jgi:hypothetical protein